MTFETAKALTSKGDHDAAIDAWACCWRRPSRPTARPPRRRLLLLSLRRRPAERRGERPVVRRRRRQGEGRERAAAVSLQVASSLALVEDEEELAGQRGGEAKEALVEDVQVAFEVLEGRGRSTRKWRIRKTACWLRLGDLDKLNGRFDSAITSSRVVETALGDGRSPRAKCGGRALVLAFALECRAADKDRRTRGLRDQALELRQVRGRAQSCRICSKGGRGHGRRQVRVANWARRCRRAAPRARELARAKLPGAAQGDDDDRLRHGRPRCSRL